MMVLDRFKWSGSTLDVIEFGVDVSSLFPCILLVFMKKVRQKVAFFVLLVGDDVMCDVIGS